MYTMKETCKKTGLSYETLKFYCNQGLIPNLHRDSQNRRVFTEKNIAWIRSLSCLKNCGMGIREMQEYVALCVEGVDSIPQRKTILENKHRELEENMQKIQESIAYIDQKLQFYNKVLSGEAEYFSNLTPNND